ncbi:TPA: AraC family ligand binding domain-containing protein [Pseudomonas aeruginosa]
MAGLQHARIGAFLEVASASLAGHRFEKHSHDEFVISANLCGLEDVWLDGRTFQADSGDLTLYNPGQIQGGGVRDGQPWRFASLYLPAVELASSLDLSSVEFDRPLLRSPALGRELAASIEALLASDRFARERGEERLLDFLGRLLAASGTRLPQRADPGRPAVARLQALLAERLAEPPDLDEMAEQVGLSKYHLLRAFKKATGLSPRQWSMQLRTRRALGLLRRGLAVGEVAHALGFADQSHLTRYFTSAYGISPGRYQRAVRG